MSQLNNTKHIDDVFGKMYLEYFTEKLLSYYAIERDDGLLECRSIASYFQEYKY